MSIDFRPDSEFGKSLVNWWEGPEEDRGSRAELRRCKDPIQVIMTPVFHRQLQQWRPLFDGQRSYENRLAQMVGLVAHVKDHQPSNSIAIQMAQVRNGKPTVSEYRFRRLIQRDREDLYSAMIRVLRLLGGRADILSIAESVYFWGDDMRKKWAYAYYENLPEN